MTDELRIARPGDTIIVRVADPITRQDADEYKARLRSLLPDGVDVVVVQAAGLMIVRPDPPPGAEPPLRLEADGAWSDTVTGKGKRSKRR